MTARLTDLRCTAPFGVPPLVSFGWRDGYLRLETVRVHGESLAGVLKSHNECDRLALESSLRNIAHTWRSANFVHGDLSPGNIIVDSASATANVKISFIDWVIDLDSHAGTPAFAASEVWRGRHTHRGDLYSLERIIAWMNMSHEPHVQDSAARFLMPTDPEPRINRV